MKEFARWTALSLAMFVSGCVSLLPETTPPAPRYHIAAFSDPRLEGAPLDWSLTVEDPRAARVYDTTRIAVSAAPGRIEFLPGVEWADRAPRLFQIALVQTFEDAGRILSVGDRTTIPVADIVLETDIRRMEAALQNGGRDVRVSVFARLGDGRGRVYAARLFETAAPAAGRNGDGVARAFNDAFQRMMPEIVLWTYEEGAAAKEAPLADARS